jgi:redox-sensitive bicupin YhaK (pirin superfamily)
VPVQAEHNAFAYVFEGNARIGAEAQLVERGQLAVLSLGDAVTVEGGPKGGRLILVAGRPLREPVAKYGPFVMNTPAEIQRAFQDYRETRFGGWPWKSEEPVFPREQGRFARHADGRQEQPDDVGKPG